VTVPPNGTGTSRAIPTSEFEELLVRADLGRVRESLTRGMAHDLRGSLQTLTLLADPRDHGPPGPTGKLRSAAVDAIDSLAAAVHRFGSVFGPVLSDVSPVIVDEVVSDAVAIQRYQRALIPAEVEVRSRGRVIPVVAAEGDLRHILLSLITNAKEALEHQPEPRLVLSIQNQDPGVELSLADNGPGFSPEMAQRLFQPFVTTRAGHLGIGLATVRVLMQRWKGTVRAAAAPEGGALVILQLSRWEG
jgi:two-component system, NtrC family, C4-dicarboxylate transport sensor histidine kinase DctB